MESDPVFQAITSYFSQDPAAIAAAGQFLSTAISQPPFLPSIVGILSCSQDQRMKGACLQFALQHLESPVGSQADPQIIEQLKSHIIAILNAETEFESAIGNTARRLSAKILRMSFGRIPWPQISALGFSLFHSNKTPFSYLLFSLIIGLLPPPEIDQATSLLLEHFPSELLSNNKNNRLAAIEFFSTVCEYIDEFPAGDLFLQAATLEIQQADEQELTKYFELINFLIQNYLTFSFFADNAVQFVQLALSVVNDQSINLRTRMIVHQIYESAISSLDLSDEQMQALFQSSVSLTLEICQVSPGTSECYTASAFFNLFAMQTSQKGGINIIIGPLNDLFMTAQPPAISAVLIVLDSIAIKYFATLELQKPPIIQFLTLSLQTNDPTICSIVLDTLSTLCQVCPNLFSGSIDDFCHFLLQNVTNSSYLVALDRLLYTSDRPVSCLNDVISALIQICQANECQFRGEAMHCLGVSLLKMSEIHEEILQQLIGPITEVAQDEDSRADVFFLLQILSITSPVTFSQTAGQFFQMAQQLLSETKFAVNKEICSFVARSALRLGNGDLLNSAFQLANTLLNQEWDDSQNLNEDDRFEFDLMRNCALLYVSSIRPDNAQIACLLQDESLSKSAAFSIVKSADKLQALEMSKIVLAQIMKSDDHDTIMALFDALESLIPFCDLTQISDEIMRIFHMALIRDELFTGNEQSLFNCIVTFSKLCPALLANAAPFVQSITALFEGCLDATKGQLLSLFNIFGLNQVTEFAIGALESPISDTVQEGLLYLAGVVKRNPQEFGAENVQALFGKVQCILNGSGMRQNVTNEAVALFMELCILLHQEQQMRGALQSLLEKLYFSEFDQAMLRIERCLSAIGAADHRYAVLCLTMSEKEWRMTDPADRQMIITIVRTISPEEVQVILRHNAFTFQIIQQRIS